MATKRKIYLRFGPWQPDERSYSRAQGTWLDGISVFPACYDARSGYYSYDQEYLDLQMAELAPGLFRILALQRPVYVVTGDDVGRGYDGEPLLRNVRVVAYAIIVMREGKPHEMYLKRVPRAVWEALQSLRKEHEGLVIHLMPDFTSLLGVPTSAEESLDIRDFLAGTVAWKNSNKGWVLP